MNKTCLYCKNVYRSDVFCFDCTHWGGLNSDNITRKNKFDPMEDCPPEYIAIVNDNFMDLI
jgi:hypothetical protein